MREYTEATSETYFFLSDHLGSTSIVTDESGTLVSELRYSAYGEERYSSGNTPTDYRHTGQLSKIADIGLYHYEARWFDPTISHFIQADTLVPGTGNPVAWDRYAGMLYNPAVYNDPSGHCVGPFLAVCLAVAGFIVDNAAIIGGVTVAAAVTLPWVTTDTVRTDIISNPQAANDEFINALGLTSGILTSGEGIQYFGSLGEIRYSTDSRSLHESSAIGNEFHYDDLNGGEGRYGPSQLHEMYPNTTFRFSRRGEAGPDVEYLRGQHPSQYSGSEWESDFNYGDFKPDTISGATKFYRDLNSGKLPAETMPLPYNPKTLRLKNSFQFSPQGNLLEKR